MRAAEKDWPQELYAASAARSLAHALSFWRARAYGRRPKPWQTLPHDERRALMDFGTMILMAAQPDVKPSKQTTDILFKLGVQLARAESDRVKFNVETAREEARILNFER